MSNKLKYFNDVMDYLEYLNYPDYIQPFQAQQVAAPIANSIAVFLRAGISYRTAALCIFGLTIKYQWEPFIKEQEKH